MPGDQRAQPRETADAAHSVLQQVSNDMVGLYKDLFGRGPTKARSSYAGPDVLICSLEETFTPAERNMAAMGEHQRLRDMRIFFQYAAEREFRDTIERITGRQVRAFISGLDTKHDVAAEVFYLQPATEGSAAGDGSGDGYAGDGRAGDGRVHEDHDGEADPAS
jgi:uncharacterized protein YbcI